MDACRAGWFSVGFSSGLECELNAFCTFACLLAHYSVAKLILVDIPMGLPEGPGGRDCDREARMRLSFPRAASVFPTPTRQTVQQVPQKPTQEDFPASVRVELACSGEWLDPPTFWIAPKIAEVDEALRQPEGDQRPHIREVHPELCFWAFGNGNAMQFSKSKEKKQAIAERLCVLEKVHQGTKRIFDEGCSKFFLSTCVDKDDIVDALAAAVTAYRGWPCELRTLPEAKSPQMDVKGLPMEMVFWEPFRRCSASSRLEGWMYTS